LPIAATAGAGSCLSLDRDAVQPFSFLLVCPSVRSEAARSIGAPDSTCTGTGSYDTRRDIPLLPSTHVYRSGLPSLEASTRIQQHPQRLHLGQSILRPLPRLQPAISRSQWLPSLLHQCRHQHRLHHYFQPRVPSLFALSLQ